MKQSERVTFAAWMLLFAVSMAGMLFLAANKTIVIAEASQEQDAVPLDTASPHREVRDSKLLLDKTYGVQGSFQIPLPKGIRAEHVTMENRYMDRELRLFVQGADDVFYTENAVSGDLSPVLSGQSEVQEDGILLKFSTDQVYEYRSTLNGSTLTIEWYRPEELFDFVVVLDPAGSEEQDASQDVPEAELTLQIARRVQRKFALPDVRLYCTRTESGSVTAGDRAGLAEDVGADFFIRLSVSRSEDDADIYGVTGIYEDEFFIPDFGSPELADLLTRETAIAASNRALGLTAAAEDSILKLLTIPAAELSVGWLSNPQEAYLLQEEVYQEKLADGILAAIGEAVEELKQLRNGAEGEM